jgi:Pyruvate/2-oxoacid:ferredoxin oxidoreductase delta subunit
MYFLRKLLYLLRNGIDVRMLKKGENIVRSSCVGCGICAAVCPRECIKLENDTRQAESIQKFLLRK